MKRIHDQKTGALFPFALEAGAIIGGADARTCEALRQFGRHFGLAYQIHNDLMDVLGSQEMTGKVTPGGSSPISLPIQVFWVFKGQGCLGSKRLVQLAKS